MKFIKKLLPDWLIKKLRPIYHACLAVLAGWYYCQPSEKMVVIGITGTAGKSTTTKMLAHILNSSGRKCGYITTISFFDGKAEYINRHGLSMPGGPLLQKQLKAILENGCQYAVVECTSEGLAQNRHLGINFSAALLTNLSPAHLDAHNGYESYLQAKAKLFEAVSKKQMTKAKREIVFNLQKFIGVNLDIPEVDRFLKYPASQKFGVTFRLDKKHSSLNKVYRAEGLALGDGLSFKLSGQDFHLDLIGDFNAYNAALAAACANMLGVELAESARALQGFKEVAGRMEMISNNLGVKIFVDYAPEPAGMAAALMAVKQLPHNNIIHVFGATGGHRDKQKGFEFGKISAQFADQIIITNDDVYDSDPGEIAKNIELGIKSAYGIQHIVFSYKTILDRREAIKYALTIARKDDIILITGKGSEQFLVLPGNKRIAWDDREAVRQELRSMN